MRDFRWCLATLVFATASISPALGQPPGSNGLTGNDRLTWYHLSQGTEIFPLQFLRVLTDADTGEPFMKNLERFGFLPDPKGPANPHGVPIGMTVETTRDLRFTGVKMIGLNCAACHTAQFEIQGLPVIRVDGGTNMFDASGFGDALSKSVKKTIENPVELLAFVGRLLQQAVRDELNLDDEGLAMRPLSKHIASALPKILESVEGDDRLIGDKLRILIREELQKPALDMSRGIITRPDDPRLDEVREAVPGKVGDLSPLFAPESKSLIPTKLFSLKLLDRKAEVTSSLQNVITTLRLLRARLAVLQSGGHPVVTKAGYGRVDAFGTARNKLFPKNPIALDAPVRYPFLWTVKDKLKYYHWDGNTVSRQERNAGQALGVGVVVDPDTRESTLRLDNLMRLEGLAMKIEAPAWPEAFGKIDAAKAARGKLHYDKFCGKCHTGTNGTAIVPLTVLETDRLRVQNIRESVGNQGFFDAISPILKETIEKAGGKPEGKDNLWRPSQQNDPTLALGYPNRPLPSIWASPPYLHNGSVPNIYQLLLPADKRVKQFPVGHREFDPDHLGYTLNPAKVLFTFDTRLSGNSNSGHSGSVYGTDQMTDVERFELIEFLKTQ